MQTTSVVKIGRQVILRNAQILPEVDPQFFDVEWHQKQGGLLGRATGRGSAYFLSWGEHRLVLRRFLRGGLIGKINADLYLRNGAENSRGCLEYRLLEWMFSHGLPVPRPVAARYVPIGLWYRADLVTELIAQSEPLADVLYRAALPSGTWEKIGSVVRRMHDLGVHHSDLNCRNILLDGEGQVWLIDFDKCARRKGEVWKPQNLARLKRSLAKEKAKSADLFWSEADWPEFMAGYEQIGRDA